MLQFWLQFSSRTSETLKTTSGLIKVGQVNDINMNNTHFIYQLPNKHAPILGIFFIAHACTHSAYDFWPRQLMCPHCVGLSEEVAVADKALNAGYLVVVVTSRDRRSGCWGNKEDTKQVSDVLDFLQTTHTQVSALPVLAYGCSSGGAFAWRFAQQGQIAGVIIQVMSVSIRPNLWAAKHPFPVVFNAMPKDKDTTEAMHNNADSLINLYATYFGNVTAASELIVVKDCTALPVTISYLMNRLYYINISIIDAEAIIRVLKQSGYLDNLTNLLLKDPTNIQNDWRSILQRDPKTNSILAKRSIILTKGKSPLAKALHRCWAFHEYCSDYLTDDLAWFKKNVKKQRV